MFTATLRGMLAHRLRLVLTTASIALGVAFLAGTLMLTDTMRLAFDQLFGQVSSGTDAVVRHESAYDATAGVGLSRAARAVLRPGTGRGRRRGRGRRGVGERLRPAHGRGRQGRADRRRRAHDGLQHAGRRGPARRRAPALRPRTGRPGRGGHRRDLRRGARHRRSGRPSRSCSAARRSTFTVVGTVGYGDEKDLGGTTSAYFDSATAQPVLGTPGAFDEVQRAGGRRRERPAELAERLRPSCPTASRP